MREKNERQYFPRNKLGVFQLVVCGTVCAYFVGWCGRWSGARNIRAGLYFPTKEAAIKFRDDIENNRSVFIDEIEQIA
jgi:hypothetical protein